MTPPAAHATAPGRHTARPGRATAAPRVHRRVSGPVRRPATAGARTAPAPTLADHLAAAAGRLSRLPDASVVGRLVSSRAWIGVVGFLLIGIVFMQVHLLKLDSGISRAVESAATLEQQNDELRVSISRMSSGTRIDSEAARLGMVRPEPGDVRYLHSRGARDAKQAARSITAPKDSYAAAGATTGAATTQAAGGTVQQAATTQPAQAAQPAATTEAAAADPSQPTSAAQSGSMGQPTDEYPAAGYAGAATGPQG